MTKKKFLFTAATLLLAATVMFLCRTFLPKVSSPSSVLEIWYFYDNPCLACEDEAKFTAFFEEQVGDILQYHDYTLRCINTFSDTSDVFAKQLERLGIAEEAYTGAMLIVGDSWLAEGDIIADHRLRQAFWREGGLGKTPEVLEYYYRDDCKDCEVIKDTIDSFFAAHPEIPIVQLDTNDLSNKEDFKALLAQENVPSERIQIPYIIYGNTHYSGNAEIEAAIQSGMQ